MFNRVRQNLRFFGCDCRVSILEGPAPRVDLQIMVICGLDRLLGEEWKKARKPILQNTPAQTEGIHKTRSQNRSIACMTITKKPFQRSQELKS